MATVGDVFQLTVKATFLGENKFNVFHYRMTVAPTSNPYASPLTDLWRNNVLTDIKDIQSDDYQYVEAYCVNLNDPGDYVVTALNETGDLDASEVGNLPGYVALRFRYPRVAAGQRNGYKRIRGLIKDQVDGNVLATEFDTAVNVVAASLGQSLVGGSGTTLVPFIAHRPITLGINPGGYIPGAPAFGGVTHQD